MTDKNADGMEGELLIYEQTGCVDAVEALSHINHYMKHSDDYSKRGLAEEAGSLILEMMDSLMDRESGDYLGLLEAGKKIMIRAIDAGAVQTSAETVPPDHNVLKLAAYVGSIGTSLAAAKYDFLSNEPAPRELVTFVTLDDICRACKDLVEKQNLRVNAKDFKDNWQGQVNRFGMDPDSIKGLLGDNRMGSRRYFWNDVVKLAADALKHFVHGYGIEKDAGKRELYHRSMEVVKAVKDLSLSDDPLHSAGQRYNAESYMFIGSITPEEEWPSIEISPGVSLADMLSKIGTSEEALGWELDSLSGKLTSYRRMLEDTYKLANDIIDHEMTGPDSTNKPDMYLLSNIERLENVVGGIKNVEPGVKNSIAIMTNVLGHKIVEVSGRYEGLSPELRGELSGKVSTCVDAKKGAIKALDDSLSLFATYDAVLHFYGNDTEDGTVMEKRISRTVFDDMLRIVKEGSVDTWKKLEHYVVERKEGQA